jgi:SAM-dependent methyltransferase
MTRSNAQAGQSDKVHHPIFARFFARLSVKAEAAGQGEHRRELLAGLSGRVIELGAGNGLNFSYYPDSVKEVVAVEPESYLRKLAAKAAIGAPTPVHVVDGVADLLPADTGSFDAGVASLVLCSVSDQDQALTELLRVIRPGGELRFYEHVRSHSPGLARLQRAVDVFWPQVGGGCHASRDTSTAIERAGFSIEACRSFPFRPSLLLYPVTPHILGIARRP